MQRLIRSFNTLTDDLRETLQEQYPDGIDNNHIRTIATAKGDSLRVIELRTSRGHVPDQDQRREPRGDRAVPRSGGRCPELAADMDDGEEIETPEAWTARMKRRG